MLHSFTHSHHTIRKRTHHRVNSSINNCKYYRGNTTTTTYITTMMITSIPPTSRCLVTGASDPGSVGYACAVALMAAGAQAVTIAGRDPGKVASAVESLQQQQSLSNSSASGGSRIYGVVADLKEPDQMVNMVAEAAHKMALSSAIEQPDNTAERIDIVVVSGANGGSEYLGMSSTDPEAYRLLHTISVISPMLLSHAAIQTFHCSSIVMISSMAAQTPWPDTAPYNTAKAAQNCLVQQLAFQYRKGHESNQSSNNVVRVNAVLPGCIHSVKLDVMAYKKGVSVEDYAALRSQCHPVERNGTVEEVAAAVVFLASPASSFLTGVLLPVDGGLHMSNWWNKPHMMAEYQGK